MTRSAADDRNELTRMGGARNGVKPSGAGPTEYRAVGTDAEGERKDGDGGSSWVFSERSKATSEVLSDGWHSSPRSKPPRGRSTLSFDRKTETVLFSG